MPVQWRHVCMLPSQVLAPLMRSGVPVLASSVHTCCLATGCAAQQLARIWAVFAALHRVHSTLHGHNRSWFLQTLLLGPAFLPHLLP
jgi:hypothetical protein